MMLVLEIEYLSGVSFAAIGPDTAIPDWPPQPDRVFSALVATWAARGEDAQEAEALEWLEKLPPPRIVASDAEPRTTAIVFVPPNDPRSDLQKNAKGVLPSLRSRQPRRFPAARPHCPTVRLTWVGSEPEKQALAALERLAHDTAYVGHSASLTRCQFLLQPDATKENEWKAPELSLYEGRFNELRSRFDGGRRPLPGARIKAPADASSARENVFNDRWFILEHVGGEMPDVRAAALVSRTIRDSLLSGYDRIGLGEKIPEEVSGHARNGSPSSSPHLAIVPLPFTGFPYADGHVLGFALVPPRDGSILDDEDFRKAFRTLAPLDEERGRRVMTVRTREGTAPDSALSVDLSPTFEASRRSLDPVLYTARSRSFATVTPIVLDRHLKLKDDARIHEMEVQIAAACRNIGLPAPDAIVVDRHSAFEGAPSARPSGNSPRWMHWRLPRSLSGRQLVHAVINFAAPVDGPVLLGAGRYVGLGLCRPIVGERR